ncbi:hypothetical protein JCM11251_003753 [Rhodosporidiobolus azoricus]
MNGQAANGHPNGYESSASRPPPPSSHFNPVASGSNHSGSRGNSVQPRASYEQLHGAIQMGQAPQHVDFAAGDSDEEETAEVGAATSGSAYGYDGASSHTQRLSQSVDGFAGDDDEDEEEEEEDVEHDDGYESEDVPLATVWKRNRNKQEGVPGLFLSEEVLPEEDFGSKTVLELYTMKTLGMIDLDPPYQRKAVWPEAHSRELIDSIFRNYHIPHLLYNIVTPNPDYDFHAFCKPEDQINPVGTARVTKGVMESLKKKDKGKGKEQQPNGEPPSGQVVREVWRCMDGKQRTTAICKFMNNEFTISGQNGQKYTYDTLPDAAREVFNSRRLRYGFYRDLDGAEEHSNFRRVQKGKVLSKAEIRSATTSPYFHWVNKIIAKFFNTYRADSFTPRLTGGKRNVELNHAQFGSTNILTALRSGFDKIDTQSSAVRDELLGSDRVPTRQEQDEVFRIFGRFHELSLIPPLKGEDKWPKTPTGKEMAGAGRLVPHRVWRLTPRQIGVSAAPKDLDKPIAVAPVEMHTLPVVIWKFDHLNNGQLLELIEQLRTHIHVNFRGEVKDNAKVYRAIKKWCNNFDPDSRLRGKYRKDGTLRDRPAAAQRSNVVAAASVASVASTSTSAKAGPSRASGSGLSASTSTSAAKKTKADNPPAALTSGQNGTAEKGKDKGKEKDRSVTSSTSHQSETTVTSHVEFSPGAILPFGLPLTTSKPVPKPRPSPPPQPIFSLPKPTSQQIPAPPPPPLPAAGSSAARPGLSAKQAKFQNRVPTSFSAAPAPPPVVQRTTVQQIQSLPSSKKRRRDEPEQQYDSHGRRIFTVPPQPVPPEIASSYDYGGPGEDDVTINPYEGDYGYDALDEELDLNRIAERAAAEAVKQVLSQRGQLAHSSGSPRHMPPPPSRPLISHGAYADDDQDRKRVKQEPDDDDHPRVDPAKNGAMRRKSAEEQRSQFEVQDLLRRAGAEGGGGGGTRRPGSRDSSRVPEERFAGSSRDDRWPSTGGRRDDRDRDRHYQDDKRDDRYTRDDRYKQDDRYPSSRSGGGYGDSYGRARPRSRSPPRGGEFGSRPYGRDESEYAPESSRAPQRRTSGEGSRYQEDRNGKDSYGSYRRDERFDRASSVTSTRSRLPSGTGSRSATDSNGHKVPPPPPGFGNGYSVPSLHNGYSASYSQSSSHKPSATDIAAMAYGNRGHALPEQNALRPPPVPYSSYSSHSTDKTLDPRRAGKQEDV